MVKVQIHFDLIAPWCYIGKRRLESALAQLGGRVSADIEWLPFEVNPGIPNDGLNRRFYRANKVGHWENAVALDARVAEAGAEEGLDFRFDRIERTPNTLDIHRLVAFAKREQIQNAVVEAFFLAYYSQGHDLSNRRILLDVAMKAGLDGSRATALLEGGEGIDEVRAESARAFELGVRNVPYFRFNEVSTLARVCDRATMMSTLERLDSPRRPLRFGTAQTPTESVREQYGFQRTRCDCDFCKVYCRHVPGRLDISDLARLCPEGVDVFAWSESHLRAVTDSPHPKLVPARQDNGHCHWYINGHCSVHQSAPFGCAFFDAHMTPIEVQTRSKIANRASEQDALANGLYSRVWRHLAEKGLTRPSGARAPLDEEMRRIQLSMEQN